jgi:gamma-glutamyltranspeptidase/glutathione hydrolase
VADLWWHVLLMERRLPLITGKRLPAGAHRDMYLDSSGEARTDKSQNGHLSCGVPGTVAGLFASSKFARLSFDK